MDVMAWANLAFYLAVLLGLAWPLGRWLLRVMDAGMVAGRPGQAIERGLYRLLGIRCDVEMSWREYALATIAFSAVGLFVLYLVQRLQAGLPLNPDAMAAVAPDSAFDTAVSFVTNTNWQGYGGESTMSQLTQMLGLTVQNFVSAAIGIAVAFALIRGFARHNAATIGNFWVDMTRITLYVLLPLSLVFALVLVSQGVVQNFSAAATIVPPDGAASTTQKLAMGPVASQEAIKLLGTNGGGYFNANSAHPFENPTPLSNLLQMLAILVIPAALCFTFGRAVGDLRQGWALIGAMAVLFVGLAVLAAWAESRGNPRLAMLGVDVSAGNLEGKEARFGSATSALFAAVTTAASCGAVNAMHDSFMPLGGMVPLLLMQFGEVVFGGVGSGLYGMLVYAVLAVFIAGLMIGRTPEYLGKKIEAPQMKMVSLALLIPPALVLLATAVAVLADAGRAGLSNPGAHGLSQALYAFTSAANNNGSAFAGLSANTPFYNLLLALAMWLGRFGVIVPVLAIAGSLAAKTRIEAGAGTMPTNDGLFVALLVATVLIVGALTYVPALALGPVAEHLQLFGGR